MQLLLILSAGCLVARGSEEPSDKRKGRDGWGPGGWETRNGVSSFGWDSRRPICPRCPQTGEYRGNGYDNLSPEWQRREQSKHWNQASGGGSGDGYADKRVWTGTIRPIENQPGGLVTNWIGGPSRWRDPWEQRDVQYWQSSRGGYAGGYGYTQGSSYGYSQTGDNKPNTFYDRSRGEAGYINHYDRRPVDDHYGTQHYARGWDYYEQRPGTTYGGGYTYRPQPSYPAYDRKNLRDCNPCRQQPSTLETIRPAGGCCGARPSSSSHRGPATSPIGPYYVNDWYSRQDYDLNRPAQDYNGRNQGSTGWNTYPRPGDYGGSAGYDYGRPAGDVTRPSQGSYGKPVQETSHPWYGTGRPNPDYGRPSPDYSRPSSSDYGVSKPDYSRPGSDYGRPSTDYGRPNPDYGRPGPDYARPSPDYARPQPDYGRPATVTKPSPADYGRPGPNYGQVLLPAPDYGRPTLTKPSPADYGQPGPDYNQQTSLTTDYGRPQPDYGRPLPDYGRPAPDYGRPPSDYGRPPADYGRPSTDYGRPSTDYGRPPQDYGRPPSDYGRPGPDYGKPDYGRPPPDYGRPGCSTCRPDPDRPGPLQPSGYPQLDGNYDGYGPSNGYKPSGGSDGYGVGSSDGGGYNLAVGGGGSYGAVRPNDPRRDDQGAKSPLDRYPGHTGVGATFEFDTDRKQGTYYYDSRPTTSRPTTTTADHSTTQTAKTS